MIYLRLFLTFLEIGAFSFGGGYGMISLIRQKVLEQGWLSEEEFLNLIAVSESTPGPIAVNMATFIGSTQAGILGSFCATLGAILPSFIIVLIITALVSNFLEYSGVKAFLGGVRPAIIALIIGTSVTMFASVIFDFKNFESSLVPDFKALAIFFMLIVASLFYRKLRKKSLSAIMMIVFSGVLGIFAYGILP